MKNDKNIRKADLFHAAANDDVDELRAATACGQRLDDAPGINRWTPLHTAAFYGSENFIREALKYDHANVWHFDVFDKTPWDYAADRRDTQIMTLFRDAMYPNRRMPLPPDFDPYDPDPSAS